MDGQVQRICSAAIDGRANTPRYIQKQLAQLYKSLQDARPAIRDAICRDSGYSLAEADTEIFLAINAVKQQYESINFQKFIDQEYSIAHGKDNPQKRIPIGYVYIIPSKHSQLYSIISPACAAIAAGNCIVIEVRYRLLPYPLMN